MSGPGCAAVVAVVVVVAACGSGENGADVAVSRAATAPPQTTVPVASTTTPLPDADAVFDTLLARVPDSDGSLEMVMAINFERVAEIFDMPDRTTDPENWVGALSSDPDGPRMHSLLIGSRNVDEWRAEVGFSTPDELGEATIRYGYDTLDLHLVDVDAAAIDQAVRTDPVWSDVLIDAEVAGMPYYAWSEVDRSERSRSTATHDSALGGFMAVADHVVVRTLVEDVLVDSLTVTRGRSLADNRDVGLILDSFAEHQVYSIALTDDIPVHRQHVDDRVMVRPYRLLGTGQAVEGNQRQAVLAYVHDDQDSAVENATRLDAVLSNEVGADGVPYADRFASFDISVDDVLVSVVLDLAPSEGAGFWAHSLLVDEPLYWADGEP